MHAFPLARCLWAEIQGNSQLYMCSVSVDAAKKFSKVPAPAYTSPSSIGVSQLLHILFLNLVLSAFISIYFIVFWYCPFLNFSHSAENVMS